MPRIPPTLLRLLALPAAAGLCAALANAFARPDRSLGWRGWVPPAPAVEPAAAPMTVPAPRTMPAPVTAPAPPPAKAPAAPQAPAAPKAPPAPRFPPDPASVTREIGSADALDAFRLGIPFLDARRSADFLEGHVRGAWSAPVWEADLETRITAFEAQARPGSRDPIVIYCSGGGCEDSHLLARKLVGLGYRNLLIYTDGFPDWTAQARPVDKGVRP